MKKKDNIKDVVHIGKDPEEVKLLKEKIQKQEDEIKKLKYLLEAQNYENDFLKSLPDSASDPNSDEPVYFGSARFLQNFFNDMPFLIWVKDTYGKIVKANISFLKKLGINQSSLGSVTEFDLFPSALAEKFRLDDLDVMHSKTQKVAEEFIPLKDEAYWFEIVKYPVISSNGEVIGTAALARDISERRVYEIALSESEEKYKDLVTLLPEIVFETNDKGRIIFINQKAFEGFGYAPSDFEKGINIYDVLAPEDIERAKIAFAKTKLGVEIGGTEYTILSADKRKSKVMVFTNNMYQDGKWIGLRGVAIDITERKKAENQEKDHHAKLLFLSQTALDFLDMNYRDNIFEYIGTRLEELVEGGIVVISRFVDDSSVLSMEYFSASHKHLDVLKKIAGQKELPYKIKVSTENIEVLRKHSEHFHEFKDGLFEASFGTLSHPICGEIEELLNISRINGMSLMRSGKLYGAVMIINGFDDLEDKTLIETFIYQASIALHRRQLENELFYTKERAVESDKLKTAFIANMSHEIRTPMNGILGLSQLMHNPRLTESEKGEYLSLINTNGKILLNLVNDIIDISRIESNQIDLLESVFSVEQLFRDLEQFFRSEKKVKNKDLLEFHSVIVLKTKESNITGDLQKIRQVLTNLISNAIKFTFNGEIEVGCRLYEENKILFFVRDTGIGIAPDQLDNVFNRFTQVDHSLTRPYGGSGLGLAICKGFIERMGGKIWVKSELNVGSVFYFCLPYKPLKEDSVVKFADTPVSKDFDWSCLCILVVEDNYVSFRLLQLSLQKTGVKILHAEDGLKAVEMVEQNDDIDLVLMDIQLPVMNGYDATRRIKTMQPNLPVIAQTANATEEDRLICLNAGASDYLTKPINLDRLYQVINDYLFYNKKKKSE